MLSPLLQSFVKSGEGTWKNPCHLAIARHRMMVRTWLCADRAGPLSPSASPSARGWSCAQQCISLWLKVVPLVSVTWNWGQCSSQACSSVTSWIFKASGIELKGHRSRESGHALGFGNVNYGVLWSAPCQLELASLIWLYPSDGRKQSSFSRQLSKVWLWTERKKRRFKAMRAEPEKLTSAEPLTHRKTWKTWEFFKLKYN